MGKIRPLICLMRGLRHFTEDSTGLTLSANVPTHIYFSYLTRGEGPATFTLKDIPITVTDGARNKICF